ncbi:MAG: SMC-Scp complex subunit ScpB [Porticoccaceae bacterium]|jgi:segregation and condensation protein B|nr:SMC-Scp complex subunit ScpB [Porticoccaceae bacterium]MBT5578062.1 SMC-Scp complex subunit ScpB [Porticoccaceae bacterium]MBT7374555.1 SMC-Scp complex subunit ScpB [Porticoccaceae bacterium]
MNPDLIRKIIEGALLAAGKPLDIARMESLFEDEERPPRDQIRAALEEIEGDCRERGFELKQVASGYRFQVRQELSTWVNRLWDEKPKRYSRAMLETLSLIAYRQPLTRGDIELVRGVAVSSDIIKTLLERDWVRVVGYRDVPGKPALYATTKQFLDYFNLKSLDHLPALGEIKDLAELDPELELTLAAGAAAQEAGAAAQAANDEFQLDQQVDGVEDQATAEQELSVEESLADDIELANQSSAPINE